MATITWRNIQPPSFSGVAQTAASGADMITSGLERVGSAFYEDPAVKLKEQLLQAQIAGEETDQLRAKSAIELDKIRGKKAEYEMSQLAKLEKDNLSLTQAMNDVQSQLVDVTDPTGLEDVIQKAAKKYSVDASNMGQLRNASVGEYSAMFAPTEQEQAKYVAMQTEATNLVNRNLESLENQARAKAIEAGNLDWDALQDNPEITFEDVYERGVEAFGENDMTELVKVLTKQLGQRAITGSDLQYGMATATDRGILGLGLNTSGMKKAAKTIFDTKYGSAGKELRDFKQMMEDYQAKGTAAGNAWANTQMTLDRDNKRNILKGGMGIDTNLGSLKQVGTPWNAQIEESIDPLRKALQRIGSN